MKITAIAIKGWKRQNAEDNYAGENGPLTLTRSFNMEMAATRGGAELHEETLANDDVVELVFNDGTAWLCNNKTLGEVFPNAAKAKRAGGGEVFEIPLSLQAEGQDRSLAGDIFLNVLNIFTKKKLGGEVRKLAAELEKKQLEHLSGLYRINAQFELQPFTEKALTGPVLLFIHGTGSSTKGSFDGLLNSGTWTFMLQTYKTILGFQHETLTKSPLQNVLELVKALPPEASLHLVTHSRGGLVGDILARFCNGNDGVPAFSAQEIKLLEKSGRQDDVKMITGIARSIAGKNITIQKFIRTACPAGGTTLASNRLDYFFNITFNLVGLSTGAAAHPAYQAFKNLTASVIGFKNDVQVLPGLEAMDPDSPFIKILNNPGAEAVIEQPLAVISGNCGFKFSLKALVVLASKLFFMKANDLIVNTRSMYMGSRRKPVIQYCFDEGGEVNHFSYFKNEKTVIALMDALRAESGAAIPGFKQLRDNDAANAERQALLGLDGGQVFKDTVTGNRPVVVLLPGIMGSSLKKNGSLVWIDYWKFITGHLSSLKVSPAGGVEAAALIKTSYNKLTQYLLQWYDVVTFPFDWRLPITEAAGKFNGKMKELLRQKQPVKIIAHSMGGVLLRDFMVLYPDTYKILSERNGFQAVLLGAPLGGSFRIPVVLFGQDSLLAKLSKIDLTNSKKDLLKIFSQMPGLLSLLPLNEEKENNFALPETWENMRSAVDDDDWPLPAPALLKNFEKYREEISKNRDRLDYKHVVYIAGKDKATPSGYRITDEDGEKKLEFLTTAEGDQSVTWQSGIPQKMIDNGAVYYTTVTHGALANEPSIFKGITELLEKGATSLLSKTKPALRGDAAPQVLREEYDFDLTPAGIENTLLGLDGEADETAAEPPIYVSVGHGDLRYASYPVMAGHFKGDGILNAEWAIDSNLNNNLSSLHRLGLYPGPVGTSEVALAGNGDFPGAVITGLGNFGELTAFQLGITVEKGVCNYLLRVNRHQAEPGSKYGKGPVGISPLLVGSGFGGLSVEASVRAIITGVQNANEKIKKLFEGSARVIEHIQFIELYEDRALYCYYALRKIETGGYQSLLNISTRGQKIKGLLGARKRLPADEAGKWWNRIYIKDAVIREASGNRPALRRLQFSASTGAARENLRDLYSTNPVIEELVKDISTRHHWSPGLAKAIFELLIPNDFKEQLKKQGHLSLILDKAAASWPWELLQDNVEDARPLCVNSGMIRQLSTYDYRVNINMVTSQTALVIADPDLKNPQHQLPGAEAEGREVARLFNLYGYVTEAPGLTDNNTVKPEAARVIEAMFSRDYKIMHLAGHGVFDDEVPENSGMLIGPDTLLTTAQIAQIGGVPELVFVNCCYLGQVHGESEKYIRQRYHLAANIGTQLIENGVKAVVAAGWAVDDAAALLFAQEFYRYMFDGYEFGEAVLRARQAVYEQYENSNNTWGAYQCYGDPFYRLTTYRKTKTGEMEFVIPLEAEVELHNLAGRIETGRNTPAQYLKHLQEISAAVDKSGVRNTLITELEAIIYSELGEYKAALSTLKILFNLTGGAYSVKAIERYLNVSAKQCVMEYKSADTAKEKTALRKNMEELISQLEMLQQMGVTQERFGLLGSACKRMAFIQEGAAKVKYYEKAARYYRLGYEAGEKQGQIYAFTNWLMLECALVAAGYRHWGGLVESNDEKPWRLKTPAAYLEELKGMRSGLMAEESAEKMNFWQMTELLNAGLAKAVLEYYADTKKDINLHGLLNRFKEHWQKAGSPGKKLSQIEHTEILAGCIKLEMDAPAKATGKKSRPHTTANEAAKSIWQLKEQLELLLVEGGE